MRWHSKKTIETVCLMQPTPRDQLSATWGQLRQCSLPKLKGRACSCCGCECQGYAWRREAKEGLQGHLEVTIHDASCILSEGVGFRV